MKKIIFIFFIIILFFSYINCYSDERFSYDGLIYKDIVGKIFIPNTNINNYILKTTDNVYYLNHTYDGTESKYGSLFLDFRNHLDDKKLLIYGHNSKYDDKALFRDLENYKKESFYKENKNIYVTLGNNKYQYLIFAVNIVSNKDNTHTKINYNPIEFYRDMIDMKENSLYETDVSILDDDFIITLQTCNYEPMNTYLLVNAKRMDE